MRCRRAYSLAEILVAMAVAAIAILALAALSMSVWKAAKFGKYTAYASNLARQPVERMQGDPSYFRNTMVGPPQDRIFSRDFEVEQGQSVRFQGELTFTALPPPQERYVRVVSRVHWVQQRTPREAVIETILPTPPE